jgi:hypothetical protein
VDEHAAVRATLGRYESAYSDLNTAAAHAVWPGVDERALARAFDSLSSQRELDAEGWWRTADEITDLDVRSAADEGHLADRQGRRPVRSDR